MDYDNFRAMNCDIALAADGQPDRIARGFEIVRDFIAECETRFTRFSETSELAQLNRSSGEWCTASPELFDIVQQARAFVDQTDGLFDPSILDALEAVGYDKSMDEIRAQGVTPTRSVIAPARSNFRTVQLDAATHTIRLPRNMRIDLGGIAKGWIAEQAAHRLAEYSEACAVNAGGDLFAIGVPRDENGWSVGLEDPSEAEHLLAVLNVPPGAVATSSITKRRWVQDGQAQHHLIDPRTARPATTDWLSVTVVAPHATTAEVFAKALLIAGSNEAARIAAHRDDLTFFAVDGRRQLWGSPKARELLNVGLEYV